jgi:hypothetical protein
MASFGREGDIHLMDPWLDDDPETVLDFLKDTFLSHYNGKRQPFGLFTHPIHLATGYPGLSDPYVVVEASSRSRRWLTDHRLVTASTRFRWSTPSSTGPSSSRTSGSSQPSSFSSG